MRVFKLNPDANHYRGVAPVSETDYELLIGFDGSSRAASWIPIRVAATNLDLPAGDCPSFRSTAPIFSLRAVEVLGDLLEASGELLPLLCPEGDYFVFNATALPDVLDESNSEIRRFASGRILDVPRYEFRRPFPTQNAIFKLPQMPKLWMFVTDVFVDRVGSSTLRGIDFRPVWSEPAPNVRGSIG